MNTVRYSTNPLSANQIRSRARKMAREAGLDRDTSDAVGRRVIERLKPHIEIDDLIREEIQRHACP